MSETKVSKFTTFTFLSLAFVWTFEGSTMAPAVGEIAKAFPGTSDFQLQSIIVIPFLTAFIFSIISGKLAKYIDKKTIAIVGLAIYGLMGVVPIFATSVNQILLFRLLIGVGAGLVLPLSSAYISELYPENLRAKLLGMASSISQLSNFIMSLLVGSILFLGWRAPFYTYGILLIIMICAIISIPKTHQESITSRLSERPLRKKEKLTLKHYWYTLLMTLLWVFGTFVTLNMALWTTAEKICDPWILGVIIAFCAAGATVGGFIWSYIYKALDGYFVAFGLFANALGFLLYYFTYSPLIIIVGTVIIGLGQGMLVPYVLYLTAKHSTSVIQKDMAFGLVTSAITFGPLVSPIFQQFLMSFNPTTASPYRYKFLCAAALLFSGALLSVFLREGKSDSRSMRPCQQI